MWPIREFRVMREGDRVPDSRVDPGRLNAAAASLSLPILLVRGLQSDIVSDASVAHFRSLVTHALVADVSGAGQMVVGDRNDALGEAISPFLASTLGADRTDVEDVLAG